MRTLLPPDFFARTALRVAPDLIGKVLVSPAGRGGGRVALAITEVEAYGGERDLASHARFGPTGRNRPMFGPPGHWYVYFVYGMHWMLNVVVESEGRPSAILLRGAGEVSGPGRLTRRLGVDKALDAGPIAPASGLWIEDRGFRVPRRLVERTPRIGVDYAGKTWAEKPWRFVVPTGVARARGLTCGGRAP